MISIGLIFILPLLSFLIGGVGISFEVPVLKQLATTSFIYEGGVSLPPELIALTLSLSLYTATFIAECVRAGIQGCLLYTSPSPRDLVISRMPSSA